MKYFIFSMLFAFISIAASSQSTSDVIKQEAGAGVRQGTAVATQRAGEKVTDKLIGKLFDKKKKKSAGNNADTTSTSQKTSTDQVNNANGVKGSGTPPESLKTYSKFDFVPGDKVLSVDDFSKDAIGDFPAAWNTNSSGEIVTASAREGHWLMLSKQGKFIPTYIQSLPDNFTYEFDILCNDKYSYYSPVLSVYFLTGKNGKEVLNNWFMTDDKRSGVKIGFHPTNGSNNGGLAYIENFEDAQSISRNQVNTFQFANGENKGFKAAHVSVWRQKQRMRVYINEDKVYDLPRAFPADKNYTSLFFEIQGDMKADDHYLLGNLKFAIGSPDTRNKLITEGKFVTSGILFDVNSDMIRPQSYGVLKDIANVLTENSSVRVKITGHTDSDGSAADNLSLSKRRAESVKAVLVKEFGLDASRFDTDGKGATQPVGSNNSSEGKANNRRVEFLKL